MITSGGARISWPLYKLPPHLERGLSHEGLGWSYPSPEKHQGLPVEPGTLLTLPRGEELTLLFRLAGGAFEAPN